MYIMHGEYNAMLSPVTGKTLYTYTRTHTLTQSHTSRKLGESLFSSAMLPAVLPCVCSGVERAEHYQQGANKNTKIKQDGAAGHVITKFYDVAQEEGSGGTAEHIIGRKMDRKNQKLSPSTAR